MYRVGILLAAVALGACSASAPPPGPRGGGTVQLRLFAGRLDKPLYLTAAPGDTAREFVVEQPGKIRIIQHDSLLSTPFLDITSQVGYDGDERGLLSVAFDPNYATNGHFFVDYTDVSGNIEVMRYTVSANPNAGDPATADTVLEIGHSTYANHNGGLLLFGPDGFLYIGTGDGGSGGDPLHNGQDSTTLLGKILRVDVSSLPYTIPSSNPFASKAPARPEIWAYGMRNPWRFSFDRQTHDLYVGDVGQDTYEEVDFAASGDPGGHNYGWNVMEGMHCYPPGSSCDQTGLTLPVLEYAHGPGDAVGCAILGGYVYRGSLAPALSGRYLYADLCSGFVRSFKWTGAVTDPVDLTSEVGSHAGATSFGEDARGELYLLVGDGSVYRFEAN
jgi:glucose/arabinose dehydrogenase